MRGAKWVDLQARGPRSALAVEHRRLIRRADPLAAARWQRRRSPAATELTFLYSGDANGVCHHLGTDYERAPFLNPMLAGRLQAGRSLLPSPHALPFLNPTLAGRLQAGRSLLPSLHALHRALFLLS
jgi:hypothetical protein